MRLIERILDNCNYFCRNHHGIPYIYQSALWPNFYWDKDLILDKLAKVNEKAGFLAGKLSTIGFNAQMGAIVETMTYDIVSSSEIKGVHLNTDSVRSSIARKLGVDIPVSRDSSHYIDGIVEMMLDAISNYKAALTDTAARDIKNWLPQEYWFLSPECKGMSTMEFSVRPMFC